MGLSSTDFSLQSIQASAFVSGGDLSPSSILRQVLQEWGDVYDGEPLSLPLPPDVPGEIPAVVLSSKDKTLSLQVARERLNLFWHQQAGAQADLAEIYAGFAERMAWIFKKNGASPGRLAALVTRLAAIPQPGRLLAEKFCRDEWLRGPLNRPEGFELHAHKVFSLLPNLRVNSWIRIKTAGQPYQNVLVEQDMNTLAEEREQRRFDKSEMASMFERAADELNKIVDLYFPIRNSSGA